MKDVRIYNSSIPKFAIPQFISHISSLCLRAFVAELLLFSRRVLNEAAFGKFRLRKKSY